MNNAVEVTIDIENQIESGVRAEYHIHDIVFAEFDRLLESHEIIRQYKKCIRLLSGFTMMTMSVQPYDTKNYSSRGTDVKSFRVVKEHDGYRLSLLNGNMYDDYHNIPESDIIQHIKDMIDLGNRKFIQLLRQS